MTVPQTQGTRLPALTTGEPVTVPLDAECFDCEADDGPWPAVCVLNDEPTCGRCLMEITLLVQ